MRFFTKKSNRLKSLRGLDWLNFFLLDPETGIGAFLPIYLSTHQWNEQLVGIVLGVGSISNIVAQTPAGALVDGFKYKRSLVALGIAILAGCALLVAYFPFFWIVASIELLIGCTSSILGPAICAISLGIVGRNSFDQRQGRNLMFNSLGKVVATVLMGLIGYYISNRSIFFLVSFFALPALFSLSQIDPQEIDYQTARGANGEKDEDKPISIKRLLTDHLLLIFVLCVGLFQFANAALMPLISQMVSKGYGQSSVLFTMACIVMTQIVITIVAPWSGQKAGVWGRKPLLLIGFGALLLRVILYSFISSWEALIAIQLLEGLAGGILSVVAVLVIADLTKGTGRFNLALGAMGTAVGVGSLLSQVIAGTVVKNYGYSTGFTVLATIALVAFLTLYFLMPETIDRSKKAD